MNSMKHGRPISFNLKFLCIMALFSFSMAWGQGFRSGALITLGATHSVVAHNGTLNLSGKALWMINERFLAGGSYQITTGSISLGSASIEELNSGGLTLGYRTYHTDTWNIDIMASFEGGGPRLDYQGSPIFIDLLVERYQISVSKAISSKLQAFLLTSWNNFHDLSPNSYIHKSELTGLSVSAGVAFEFH
ncbi:MAG: hypothetical protein LWX56_06905 [Ignavibacteria bacterium]|nr:hypothetical protein [Ignavibacteria bacterium]